eukprot:scaffold43367_cov29-Tisochrysis_lutea.AAC.3
MSREREGATRTAYISSPSPSARINENGRSQLTAKWVGLGFPPGQILACAYRCAPSSRSRPKSMATRTVNRGPCAHVSSVVHLRSVLKAQRW